MFVRRSLIHRRGAVLLEAILAIPVLVLVTFAAVQYGQAVVVEQAIGAAADEGAREAAKGATPNEVLGVVENFLSSVNLMAGAGVRIDVQDGQGNVNMFGDNTLPDPVAGLAANEVRVTIQANYTATAVPNALGYFGIDLSNSRFQSSALARFQ